MRASSSHLFVCAVLLAAGAMIGLPADAQTLAVADPVPTKAPQSVAPDRSTVTVEVIGLRNGRGQVLCKIFDSDRGWPGSDRTPIQRTVTQIQGRSASCQFKVPPGRYAIAVAHDENRNRKLDTNLLGIPKEAFGFSAGAKAGTFGPPDYDEALFTARAGATTERIRLTYP